LSFLDVNVIIILTLMFIIGIINMGSALLVLILVRTSFIGVLKSLGASNWSIQKIFLYQVGQLIWKGMLIGNCVGILVCTIQYFFKPFSLNPEVYYLDSVPVEFTWVSWFLLNISTLVICLTALLLPSILITRIQPAKAVRFN
jgi:lipoprotein-releasing system permease protein